MTSRHQREWEAARAAEAAEAAEAGETFFAANPEAMLIEVWRHADQVYGQPAMHKVWAFYLAFQARRFQREEYLREVQS